MVNDLYFKAAILSYATNDKHLNKNLYQSIAAYKPLCDVSDIFLKKYQENHVIYMRNTEYTIDNIIEDYFRDESTKDILMRVKTPLDKHIWVDTKLVTSLKILKHLAEHAPNVLNSYDNSLGICFHLSNLTMVPRWTNLRKIGYELVAHAALTWEHYSGNISYPISVDNGEGNWEGDGLKMRLSLLEHMIRVYTELVGD